MTKDQALKLLKKKRMSGKDASADNVQSFINIIDENKLSDYTKMTMLEFKKYSRLMRNLYYKNNFYNLLYTKEYYQEELHTFNELVDITTNRRFVLYEMRLIVRDLDKILSNQIGH